MRAGKAPFSTGTLVVKVTQFTSNVQATFHIEKALREMRPLVRRTGA